MKNEIKIIVYVYLKVETEGKKPFWIPRCKGC